jgi:tetratricopeptide (TPR) repeat protein
MKPYRLFLILALAVVTGAAADVSKGRELYLQGKYDEAADELRRAVEENGENAAAQRMLGMVLLEQDRPSDAEKYIRRAAEMDSGGDSKIGLARLYIAQKQYDKAQEALEGASGEDLEYVRGLLNFHKKEYQQSADDLEAYLEKNPGHPYAHYYAGLAWNSLRKPDRMLSHFERFIQLKPDAPEARKVRSVLKTGR